MLENIWAEDRSSRFSRRMGPKGLTAGPSAAQGVFRRRVSWRTVSPQGGKGSQGRESWLLASDHVGCWPAVTAFLRGDGSYSSLTAVEN